MPLVLDRVVLVNNRVWYAWIELGYGISVSIVNKTLVSLLQF